MNEELDIGQSAALTDVAMRINHYRLSTPGLYVCLHVPVQLDEEKRLVPGLIAQVNAGKLKQCDPGDYRFFSGPPNFVFDVFRDDHPAEYEDRLARFENAGVVEYVAWFVSDGLPIWNRLVGGRFQEIREDEPGMIKSLALQGVRDRLRRNISPFGGEGCDENGEEADNPAGAVTPVFNRQLRSKVKCRRQ